MPLRDHFRPPLNRGFFGWTSTHSNWAVKIVDQLNLILPARYAAGNHIHLGAQAQVDVGTGEIEAWDEGTLSTGTGNGGVATATAVWAPPAPARTDDVGFADLDVLEIQV